MLFIYVFNSCAMKESPEENENEVFIIMSSNSTALCSQT